MLNVTRGKMSVTHGLSDLGLLNYIFDSMANRIYTTDLASSIKNVAGLMNCKCSIMSPVATYEEVIRVDNTFWVSGNGNVSFNKGSYTSASDFKTAMNGVMFAYELATPFDIDLTPQVISAVVGVNNVYSDTNGNTTVKFKDSIKHYIDTHTGG